MDDKILGHSKCIKELVKQMEEQRLKPVVPEKPLFLLKEKPIPAPRNKKKRESYCGTSSNAYDLEETYFTAEDNHNKNERPIKLKRSKTFAIPERPSCIHKEEKVVPNFDEAQLEMNSDYITSFTKSEEYHLDTLKIIIHVFMMALKKRSAIETDINMEAIESLIDMLINGQTKFVLDDLKQAKTYEEILDCFSKNENLFYTYRGFFLQKCSFVTFPITRPNTNFKTEVNLRQFLNDRIMVYKKILNQPTLASFNCEAAENALRILNWITMDVDVKLEVSKPLTTYNTYDIDRFFKGQEIPEAFFQQPTTLARYGNYLLRNKFKVTVDSETSGRLCVHLFSKIILFTEELKNGCFYKFHLNLDEIGYSPARNNAKYILEITQYVNSSPVCTYRLEGHSKDVDNWKNIIQSILREQQERAKIAIRR